MISGVGLNRNVNNSLKRLGNTFCDCVNDEIKFRHLNLLARAFELAGRYDVAKRFFNDAIIYKLNSFKNSAFSQLRSANLEEFCGKLALSKLKMLAPY